MARFYVHKDGKVLWEGQCPDGDERFQAPPGYAVAIGIPPAHMRPDPEPPVQVGYDVLRRREYPTIGDQLDVLWKALEPMIKSSPEAKTMLERIGDIKRKYPKPL